MTARRRPAYRARPPAPLVELPAPLGPRAHRTRPEATSRFMSAMACTSPKRLEMPWSSRSAMSGSDATCEARRLCRRGPSWRACARAAAGGVGKSACVASKASPTWSPRCAVTSVPARARSSVPCAAWQVTIWLVPRYSVPSTSARRGDASRAHVFGPHAVEHLRCGCVLAQFGGGHQRLARTWRAGGVAALEGRKFIDVEPMSRPRTRWPAGRRPPAARRAARSLRVDEDMVGHSRRRRFPCHVAGTRS